MEKWIDEQIKDTWIDGQIHGQMERYMDRKKDTWIDE